MLIKQKKDIAQIKKGGKILAEILAKLTLLCQPGVSSWEIDRQAEKMILVAGGRPAFKKYRTHPTEPPFPATICASFNEEVVHGIPRKQDILENGDIFSIDIGMEWPYKENKKSSGRGYFTDTAVTIIVGEVDEKVKKLLQVTREALEVGIKTAKPGNSVAEIGRQIEKFVKSKGNYGIVHALTGHGVGHDIHEEPAVPNFYDPALKDFILQPGMVIAIEPMVTLGTGKVKIATDGWTIITADKSLSAHFEHTVIIGNKSNTIATRRPKEKLLSSFC
jgi:methionyl aminopeptidase